MSAGIVNKVASSVLKTIDLESYYTPGERITLDIKDQLFQGQILREKDFREFLKTNDWSAYQGKHIAIGCSVDAVVPTWAYMLLASVLAPVASTLIFGTLEELEIFLFRKKIEQVNWSSYQDAKVVIKGCSKVEVPVAIYVEVTQKRSAIASSVMYGEPCSTVPILKNKAPK